MSDSLRAEIASLLKKVADQRKRIKELHDHLERLYARMSGARSQTVSESTLEMKAGPARKTSRKK